MQSHNDQNCSDQTAPISNSQVDSSSKHISADSVEKINIFMESVEEGLNFLRTYYKSWEALDALLMSFSDYLRSDFEITQDKTRVVNLLKASQRVIEEMVTEYESTPIVERRKTELFSLLDAYDSKITFCYLDKVNLDLECESTQPKIFFPCVGSFESQRTNPESYAESPDANYWGANFPSSIENFEEMKSRIKAQFNSDNLDLHIFEDQSYVNFYIPNWMYPSIEPLHGRYINNYDQFHKLIDELVFIPIDYNQVTKILESFPTPLLVSHMKIRSYEKKHRGYIQQISGLEASLNRIDIGDSNTHSAREQLILSTIKFKDDNLVLLRAAHAEYKKILNDIESQKIYVKPAMDSEQQQEASNMEDQAVNTALGQTALDAPTVVTDQEPNTDYVDEILTDSTIPHQYSDLTSRYILVDTQPINRLISRGQVLKQYHLPAFAVLNKWNTPNMLPFRNHEFFTGSMKVKFQWNIPKTNQFAVQIGIVYHWLQRDRKEELINVHSISQQPGGSLIGHIKDSTEIDIPFMSYAPTIPIRQNNHMMNLYYVTLTIIAMTPYQIADGAVENASLNLYFKFGEDLKFYGQRESVNEPPTFTPFLKTIRDAVPAMLKVKAAKVAKSFGRDLIGSANRIVSNTLSSATKRINSKIESGISQGLSSLTGNRDKPTNFENEALHQRATTNIASGSGGYSGDSLRLIQTGNTPHPDFLFGVEKYSSIDQIMHTEGFINSFETTVNTPAGTRLARFLIQPAIAEQMQEGALFPSREFYNWTPLDHMSSWFMNYQMKLHYRFVIVADGFKTFRFRVVYVPNSRDITYEESDSCYFMTFDVGPDLNTQSGFDFIVPYIHNQLNYNSRTTDGSAVISGSIVVFLETTVNAPSGMSSTFDTLVYKRAALGESIFSVPRDGTSLLTYNDLDLPLPEIPDPSPPPIIPPEQWVTFPLTIAISGLVVTANDWAATATISTPFTVPIARVVGRDRTAAFTLAGDVRFQDNDDTRFVNGVYSLVGTWNPSILSIRDPRFLQFDQFDAAALRDHETRVYSFEYTGSVLPIPTFTVEEGELIRDAVPAMDARESQDVFTDLTTPISTVNESIHGENHMDLLTNLRRFTYHHEATIEATSSNEIKKIWTVPVSFGGAINRGSMNEVQRADKMTHLHDAMRFTRGSIRYMIIVEGSAEGTIFVRHVPQVRSLPIDRISQKTTGPYDRSGFGESIISLRQNNVHQVEFPLYLPNAAVLNASYLSSEYLTQLSQSLGVVEFYWLGPVSTLRFVIYRAAGDDMQMYMFNGFPIRESRPRDKVINFYNSPTIFDAHPAMFKGPMTHELSQQDRALVQQAISQFERMNSNVSDFTSHMTDNKLAGRLWSTLGIQIGHLIVNPTLTTFILSGSQILVNLGLFKTSVIDSLQSVLTKAWSIISAPFRATPAMDNNPFAELCGMITTAICSFYHVKDSRNVSSGIIGSMFSYGATIQQRIIDFFEKIIGFIKNITEKICETYFPDSRLLKWLQEDIYQSWLKLSTIVTDATLLDRIENDPLAIEIIYLLSSSGDELSLRLSKNRRGNLQIARLLQTNLTLVKKLRDKLGKNVGVPVVKYPPFVYYIAGTASQIGKSSMLDDISRTIADRTFGKLEGLRPIFVVPESETYWENYKGQEVIHFDDFGRLTRTDVAETDSARLAALFGGADTTIPKAFEDKGRLSVCKLIGCASNITYPVVNGISNSVVWNRRNVVLEVTSDFSLFKVCENCRDFAFSCGRCRKINSEIDLNKREWLTFKIMDPKRKDVLKTGLNYAEALAYIVTAAKDYYEVTDVEYAKKLKDLENETGGRKFLIPEKPLERFTERIASIEVQEFIAQFSNSEVKQNVAPAMFKPPTIFGMVAQMTSKIYGNENLSVPIDQPIEDLEWNDMDFGELTDEITCLHDSVDVNSEVVFFPGRYAIRHPTTDDGTGLTPKSSNWIANNKACSDFCTWNLREAMFFEGWIKQYFMKNNTTVYPENFPERLKIGYADTLRIMVDQVKNQLEQESWAKTCKWLTGIAVGAMAAFAVYKLYKTFQEEPENGDKGWHATPITNPMIPTNPPSVGERIKNFFSKGGVPKEVPIVAAHPALQSSGDVRTKFRGVLGRRVKVNTKGVISKPAMDTELQAMLRTYAMSIIEIGITDSEVMRCVCITDVCFVTQLHSYLTISNKVAFRINTLQLAKKHCDTCDVTTWYQTHTKTCVEKCYAEVPLIVRRRLKNGQSESVQITFDQFLEQNMHSTLVDEQGSDMTCFTLRIRNFKVANIEKYLPDIEYSVCEENLRVNEPGRILKPPQETDFKAKNARACVEKICYRKEDIREWSRNEEETFLLDGYSCDQIDQGRFGGACGCIIYDESRLKIIGILSGSAPRRIYFNAISAEDAQNCSWFLQIREITFGKNKEPLILTPRASKYEPISNIDTFQLTSESRPAMNIYHSTKTTIRKSECHEVFGPVKRAPCNISQDGDRGQKALINGLKNYVPHDSFPEQDIREAIMDVQMMFEDNNDPIIPVVSQRTTQEAVTGIEGHIPRITMSTSPGMPWCCYNGMKRKKDLLVMDENHKLAEMHTDLKDLIDYNESQMRQGIVPLTINQISHKDERLELHKLDNVRLIQGSPLDLTISSRKYMMDFNYAFQMNRNKLEHQVGINPASTEWDTMTRSLLDFSPYIIVGDYSKFGPRLLTRFVEGAYEIINAWYTIHGQGQDNHVRTILGKRVINGYNIAYDHIFKLQCGSPSGAFNTVIINSLCNMMYMRCAWIGIMKEKNMRLASASSFKKYVNMFVYGDDIIASVKEEVIGIFNNQTISDYLAQFRVKYTDITKGESMRKYCTIEEATFLKCGFRHFTETSVKSGFWICVPNMQDVLDTTNWVRVPKGVRKEANIEDILLKGARDNCVDALRKSWFHGRNTFEEFQNKIRVFWRNHPSYRPTYFSFEGLQREYGYPTLDMKVDEVALMDEEMKRMGKRIPWKGFYLDGFGVEDAVQDQDFLC